MCTFSLKVYAKTEDNPTHKKARLSSNLLSPKFK